MDFACWMLYRRELLGLSFDDLAKSTGLSRATLLAYEMGMGRNRQTMKTIAAALW